MDRFHNFVPGWEIPKNKEESLTRKYGLIIEYLAEAFHHSARQTNRFAQVKSLCRLGPGFDQRDQTAVLKTVCAFVKILHPGIDPTQEEANEYLEYAIEARRRVKEQLNKLKPDDEFANINLGYYNANEELITVYCPESKGVQAMQAPEKGERVKLTQVQSVVDLPPVEKLEEADEEILHTKRTVPQERSYKIYYDAIGHSYEAIFGDYLPGAKEIIVEDPYIRQHHQILNFLRFCELAVKNSDVKKISLVTKFEDDDQRREALEKLQTITDSLQTFDVALTVKENHEMHDREVRLSNGWKIKIGRGFDIYQRPNDWLDLGASDLDLRACLETNVDITRIS